MNWDIVSNLSQAIIAIAALLALKTWEEQMKGGGKYIVAKNLLIGAKNVQGVIQKEVRNPGIHPAEAGKEHNEYNYQYLVYQNRLKRLYDYKRENFDGYAIEGEVLLGKKIRDIVFEFNKKVEELRSAIIFGYGMFTGDQNQDIELWKQAREKINKNRELLWNTGLEDDRYSKELESVIKKLDEEISQYIR